MAKERPLPKTLGACVDELGVLREALSEIHRDEERLKARRLALETKLLEELPASDAEGIAGKTMRATVVSKRVPSIKDWNKLTKYVQKTGAFDLLRRQVSTEAVQERWDAKKPVPGVEGFTKKSISLTKK